MDLELLATLARPAATRIVLLVMDGLGGLPDRPGGPTELEAASTPNLDELARQGICRRGHGAAFSGFPGIRHMNEHRGAECRVRGGSP